jgi:hypothetical protein
MSNRVSISRWETTFAHRVRRFGVSRLARELAVDPGAIYQWIRGNVSPRPVHALLIVQVLASAGIRLRLEDIYSHRTLISATEPREHLQC